MVRRRDDDDDDDDDFEEEDEDEAPRRSKKGDGIPAGTPRVYVHKKCKGETEMPAKYIREYLENPFELGETPRTYCAECEKDVPWKDCTWVETKQNLYEYIDDLRARMVIDGGDPRTGPTYLWWMPLGIAVLAGLGAGFGTKKVEAVGLWGGVLAGVLVGAGSAVYFWFMFQKEKKESEEWNRKLVGRYYKRHPEAKAKGGKKRRPADDDDE